MRPVPYKRDGGCGPRARRWRSPSCSDTMERLMRLVVAQGETIQNQIRRLNQRDTQIETYEQQMHLLRVQSLGNDYLLSSYLHDQQNQPQEYPGLPPPPPNSNNQLLLAAGEGENCYQAQQQHDPTFPASRSQMEELNVNRQQQQQPNAQQNQSLIPGLPVPREVYAKPINLQGNPNELFVQGSDPTSIRNSRESFSRNYGRFSGRFTGAINKDETISEEKSNDSGVVVGEDSLGNSVEERTHSELDDFTEEEVNERILLLSKMDEALSRLLHDEEVIQGLSSTIEIIQTQQKQETSELEEDLKRAAEEHSLLVAEVRSNEQQIRVLDTSASQKKKLIDALLKDERDSDHETRYLQAQLDYILQLPPTAFRLPEEGDDPPPLPPPPVHPACLVQSLMHNQPAQLLHPTPTANPVNNHHNRKDASLGVRQNSSNSGHISRQSSPHHRRCNNNTVPPISSFVVRPPSPNILLSVNGTSSPSIAPIAPLKRAPSPILRYGNRSCSPNKRIPLQPPPYNHIKHTNKVALPEQDLKDRLQLQSNNNKNINSDAKDLVELSSPCSNSVLKGLVSNSLPCLPNKINPILSSNNKNLNIDIRDNSNIVSGNLLKQNIKNINSSTNGSKEKSPTAKEDSSEDIPPPLPSCPPPPLVPAMNNAINIINDNINNNITKINSIISNNNEDSTKRNILNTLGNKLHLSKSYASSSASTSVEDDDSGTHTSGASSRSSTASETSISNCSSTTSSATANDNYLHSTNTLNNKITHMNTNINISRNNAGYEKERIQNNNKLDLIKNVSSHNNNIVNNNKNLKNSNEISSVKKKETDSGDSNSDTGLSSLHSSSDEGYPLDTLV